MSLEKTKKGEKSICQVDNRHRVQGLITIQQRPSDSMNEMSPNGASNLVHE